MSASGGPRVPEGPVRALLPGFWAHMWAQRADQGPFIYEGFYIGSRLGGQLGNLSNQGQPFWGTTSQCLDHFFEDLKFFWWQSSPAKGSELSQRPSNVCSQSNCFRNVKKKNRNISSTCDFGSKGGTFFSGVNSYKMPPPPKVTRILGRKICGNFLP